MAERLGEAVLELKTDDAKFTKGVGRAKGKAEGLNRGLGRTTRAANKLGRRLAVLGGRLRATAAGFFSMRNAAVAAAGIVGLGLLAKKALDFADNIAKTADKLGVTTEALQLMRFAADKAGLSQEKFDKSLGFFGKVLGEARTGIGTLRDMLLKTNPALLKQLLATDSITEAFDLMIQTLFNTKNQMDKMALSAAAFGRSGGLDMINVAKDGGVAWREWIEVAKEFGIAIEDPLLRQAEAAVDALSFLGDAVKAQVTKAFLELAPEITRVATELAESIPTIAEWGRAQVGWIKEVVQAFGSLFDVIGIAIGGYKDLLAIAERFLSAEPETALVNAAKGIRATREEEVAGFKKDTRDIIVFLGENLRALGATFGFGTGRTFTTPAPAGVPSVPAAPSVPVIQAIGRLATPPGAPIGSGAQVTVPIVINADMAAGLRSLLIQMVPQISEEIIQRVQDALRRDPAGPFSGARP